ncbi:putative Retrovirus-related Pol polyprotein from transposon TNT 1-94 [Drepanopeziza brunnea f. sp. 'multigermtubi' MB_m1]|uniref:Putative Retrovirus-related Pol polyprotein from transposon TNT 1-94 n=1 Tax=Marssonina brunnea f. sp. multigermtubi (strain MB_m1) TaxID=1072389 RepID=K1W5W0_MARBU|nr:putative Retrovirus-related Pol polyprotein from transposon TNT 1-94 [Drepanopeziza brunnea f. sp. 'multigermtubi' MB_m1]EKD12330.1 putative Retrovirus-related Pol polyprotein from transposon TNT 1-94 [Drepanopeziza brunnea f. sp. 'multigermtubi' MB_m1]
MVHEPLSIPRLACQQLKDPQLDNKKLTSSRLVLRNKVINNKVVRKKAKLVLKEYEQQKGINYFKTFALIIKHTTLRVLLAFAAFKDFEIDYVDIDTAFLNATLKEDIYMHIPDDECDIFYDIYFELRSKLAYIKLIKSLYGLKQALKE